MKKCGQTNVEEGKQKVAMETQESKCRGSNRGRCGCLGSACLPLRPPEWKELGLAGVGGPVLLELLTGGWNEPDRKMPSERGRGLRAVGGG